MPRLALAASGLGGSGHTGGATLSGVPHCLHVGGRSVESAAMQSQHSYPHRRQPAPLRRWFVRPDVSVDADPLPARPATRARTIGIRQIFFALGDAATVQDIGEICLQKGLLDGLSPSSAYEIVMAALRPVATANYWDSAQHHAQVHAASRLDAPRVRLR